MFLPFFTNFINFLQAMPRICGRRCTPRCEKRRFLRGRIGLRLDLIGAVLCKNRAGIA